MQSSLKINLWKGGGPEGGQNFASFWTLQTERKRN